MSGTRERRPLKVFLVAGEHSGDALGAKLMSALNARVPYQITYAGVGAEAMEGEGLCSLYPMADVAVMGVPAARTRASAIALSGTRIATLPVFAVTFNGNREEAFTMMVSGPGQNFCASA